jgi:hypothetical protein
MKKKKTAMILHKQTKKKSGRIINPSSRYALQQFNLFTQGHKETEYSVETAKVIAKSMN